MEIDSPATSLTLLERLRTPDRADAWERFVRLYTPVLHAWARKQGFQTADAADLAQEVLVKLVAELPRYARGAGQSFRGWLFRVTANVCCDFRRRRATRPLPAAAGLSGVAEEPVEFGEAEYRKALVDRGLVAIRGLFEPATWAAFEGLMVHARKAADVAAELGLSRNAVYIAQSRVLARLRQVIGEFLDESAPA
jgi:RNA polymerase sigma-70 factor (ECF subfamily)